MRMTKPVDVSMARGETWSSAAGLQCQALVAAYLLLHCCYLGKLLRVLHAVVHVHLQPWPASTAALRNTCDCRCHVQQSKQGRQMLTQIACPDYAQVMFCLCLQTSVETLPGPSPRRQKGLVGRSPHQLLPKRLHTKACQSSGSPAECSYSQKVHSLKPPSTR